jgi:hypothetical protein
MSYEQPPSSLRERACRTASRMVSGPERAASPALVGRQAMGSPHAAAARTAAGGRPRATRRGRIWCGSRPGTRFVLHARPSPAPGPWAWTVALTPLVMFGVAILAAAVEGPGGSTSGYVLLGAVVASVSAIFAAWRDTRALRAAGEPVDSG